MLKQQPEIAVEIFKQEFNPIIIHKPACSVTVALARETVSGHPTAVFISDNTRSRTPYVCFLQTRLMYRFGYSTQWYNLFEISVGDETERRKRHGIDGQLLRISASITGVVCIYDSQRAAVETNNIGCCARSVQGTWPS